VSRSVLSSRSASPRTPFMGVRISWLMVARNSLLTWDWARASSRACSAFSVARRRSVTSRETPQTAYSSPAGLCRGNLLDSKTRCPPG
jgi:hypothetical protein